MHTGQCGICYIKPEIMQSSSTPGKDSKGVCEVPIFLRQRQCGSVVNNWPLSRQVN